MRSTAAYRIEIAALCLGLTIVAPGPAQIQPAPDSKDVSPLEITVHIPEQCYVDQLVTLRVDVRNTGKERLGKKTLQVDILKLELSRTTVASPMGSGGGPLHKVLITPGLCSENVVQGERRLALKALAPGKTAQLTLKLTFRHHGDLMTIRVGERSSAPQFEPLPPPTSEFLNSNPDNPQGVTDTQIKIVYDPKTPLRAILPTPPTPPAGPATLPGSLEEVPEVSLQKHVAKFAEKDESLVQTMRLMGQINLLNEKKADAFVHALLPLRADLAGLPFVTGDACRPSEERNRQFGLALTAVHRARLGQALPPPQSPPASSSSAFKQTGWRSRPGLDFLEAFRRLYTEAESADRRLDAGAAEHAVPARVAALMQVLGPEAVALRLELVKYLAATPHAEATRALARLVLFSEEVEVRSAAVLALGTRREQDYTDLLVEGLAYPWPAVARRSSEAIVQLERTDLVPKLLDVLDRPDPRLPTVQRRAGKKATILRELVRVNHHRNCLLCHPPVEGDLAHVSEEKIAVLDMLVAQVPLADQELPTPSPATGAYDVAVVDILVRIDATYLRQDFSVKQPVGGAAPWPEMQRFDFVVRSRELSEEEARAFRDLLQPSRPGAISPYHAAALFALRELTGLDTEPNAQAWRKLLSK